ncbi:Protein of unknown function [Gryllus bimaculatus]|nr:Protein of unknown function [Gryllus bimaculatus]
MDNAARTAPHSGDSRVVRAPGHKSHLGQAPPLVREVLRNSKKYVQAKPNLRPFSSLNSSSRPNVCPTSICRVTDDFGRSPRRVFS